MNNSFKKKLQKNKEGKFVTLLDKNKRENKKGIDVWNFSKVHKKIIFVATKKKSLQFIRTEQTDSLARTLFLPLFLLPFSFSSDLALVFS